MAVKILFKKKYIDNLGVTIIELVLAIFILFILFFVVMLNANPVGFRAKSRDEKRISDLRLLERMITEYRLDNGIYPDTANITRFSNILPGSQASLTDPRSGWIIANLIEYNVKLPIDPINDDTYRYKYVHDDDMFELNTRLEYLIDNMSADAGNDPNSYEIGTDLTLITP